MARRLWATGLLLLAACATGKLSGPGTRGRDGGVALPDASTPVWDAGRPLPPPPGVDAGTRGPDDPPLDAGAPRGDAGVDAGPETPPPVDPPPVDPGCYTEPVAPDADISDLVSRYGGADWKDVLLQILERRHPASAYLLDEQRDDSYFPTFSDPRSWGGMVGWLDTLVHEETHLYNAYHAIDVGEARSIYVREDLIYYFDHAADDALDGFARSQILSRLEVGADGIYASTYLTGWQGERGFLPLLDETAAYVNEMATLAVLGEHYPGAGVSSRDGSVAMLYFVAVYLQLARDSYPDFYERLRSDSRVKEIVRTEWLRTWFFLELSDRFPALGIHDGDYREALGWPETLETMRHFLGETVGTSPCVGA